MAKRLLKNFNDLEFIQQIDKPKYLRPLLEPWAAHFTRHGLSVPKLSNTEDHERKLLEIFTSADEEMPGGLLDVLYLLDDLSDEAGHDRIMEQARKAGVSLSAFIRKDLSPGEFAIAVFHQHPKTVREAQETGIFRKMRTYTEFQAKSNKGLTLEVARQKARYLEEPMAKWFDESDRSRVCDIYVYEEDSEIHFEITHGRVYRTEASIDKTLRRSRVAFRPQKHDSVIYDTETGILKLSAQTLAEKNLYRTMIGKVLFGDENHFPDGQIYTLMPLRKTRPKLSLIPGISAARLTEVWIELDAVDRFVHIVRAEDVLARAQQDGIPNLTEGRLIRAAMNLKFDSGGRARKLEIRIPNVANYDRARDGATTEAFLKKNGFLKKTER